MTPLQNFVIIKVIERKLSDIIITPDLTDVEPDDRGEVIALGEKVVLPIKKGDKVVFKPHLFEPIDKSDKKSNLIGREDAIIAKYA